VVPIAGVRAIAPPLETTLVFAHPLGAYGENSRLNVVQSSRVLLQDARAIKPQYCDFVAIVGRLEGE
jgi:hypothetical protein